MIKKNLWNSILIPFSVMGGMLISSAYADEKIDQGYLVTQTKQNISDNSLHIKANLQNPSREETLKNVEEALGKYKSFKSEFVQLSQDGNMVEGSLYLERPGKLRFEYSPEVPFLVVSNGTLISFIDYELKEVTRWPISKTPLGLLVDENISLQDARIEIPKLQRMAGLLKVTVIDPDRIEFGQMTLVFEESTMEFKGWEILDAQGFTTRVNLFNVVYDEKIDKKKFKFTDPRPKRRQKR